MSKTIYKAPLYFQKLYSEGEAERENFLKYIAQNIGYGEFWVEKNMKMALEKLNSTQRERAYQTLDRIEVIKKYAWSRYYYSNWDKVKDTVASPLNRVDYDPQKKRIIVKRATGLEKKFKELSKNLKSLIKNSKKPLK